MKEYFVKLLPSDKEEVRCNNCMEVFEDDNSEYLVDIDGSAFYGCSNCLTDEHLMQPFSKRFLCSTNIELGDTYYHDSFCPYPDGELADTNTKVMNANMMIDNEGENYEGDVSFKVIGEILTEGIKEGQEFTEKEASYLTLKSLQR